MKSYTKVYLDYMEKNHNLLPHELICEIKDCNNPVVDIHHVLGKGKHPELKNDINNLVGLCRCCHEKYGQNKKYIEMFKDIINGREG